MIRYKKLKLNKSNNLKKNFPWLHMIKKLAKMMSIISKGENLSKIYKNHLVRATAITFWSRVGLPADR